MFKKTRPISEASICSKFSCNNFRTGTRWLNWSFVASMHCIHTYYFIVDWTCSYQPTGGHIIHSQERRETLHSTPHSIFCFSESIFPCPWYLVNRPTKKFKHSGSNEWTKIAKLKKKKAVKIVTSVTNFLSSPQTSLPSFAKWRVDVCVCFWWKEGFGRIYEWYKKRNTICWQSISIPSSVFLSSLFSYFFYVYMYHREMSGFLSIVWSSCLLIQTHA